VQFFNITFRKEEFLLDWYFLHSAADHRIIIILIYLKSETYNFKFLLGLVVMTLTSSVASASDVICKWNYSTETSIISTYHFPSLSFPYTTNYVLNTSIIIESLSVTVDCGWVPAFNIFNQIILYDIFDKYVCYYFQQCT
jgi:hypothetical protein